MWCRQPPGFEISCHPGSEFGHGNHLGVRFFNGAAFFVHSCEFAMRPIAAFRCDDGLSSFGWFTMVTVMMVVGPDVGLWSSSVASALPVWPCSPTKEGLSMVWVPAEEVAGIITTPDFPGPFRLPLKCVWIFNNTAQLTHIHLFINEFYLVDNLTSVVHLSVKEGEELLAMNPITWEQLEGKGTKQEEPLEWQNITTLTDDHPFTMLMLDIPQSRMDFLHVRVLEVDESYGFNISFERTREPDFRHRNSCNLLHCNLNGVCKVGHNTTDPKNLGEFYCQCATPKWNPSGKDQPFSGDQCQYFEKQNECTASRNNCAAKDAECNYFTSRYVECKPKSGEIEGQCQEGYHGHGQCHHHAALYARTSDNRMDQFYAKVPMTLAEAKSFAKDFAASKLSCVPEVSDVYVVLDDDHSGANGTCLLYFGFNSPIHLDMSVERDRLRSCFEKLLPKGPLKLTPAGFKVYPKDMGIKELDEGAELIMTCIVEGSFRPEVSWFKDDQMVVMSNLTYLKSQRNFSHQSMKDLKTPLSNNVHRYIDIESYTSRSNIYYSIITVKPVFEYDRGIWTCQVKEQSVGQGFGRPVARAIFKVDVIQSPKIEVFPLSTTFVSTEVHRKSYKYVDGNNTLHCFVDQWVSTETANRYRFYWQKNGVNITNLPESRTEHEEKLWEPRGLCLKLGLINESAIYSCNVFDERNPKFHTKINVQVFVVKSRNEICSPTAMNEISWPQTMKGQTAWTACGADMKGYKSLTCSNTSIWLSNQVNYDGCTSKKLLLLTKKVKTFLAGFQKSNADSRILKDFFEETAKLKGSSALHRADMDLVLNTSIEIINFLHYIWIPNIDFNKLACIFYEQFLSTIMMSVSGPTQLMEVQRLLRASTIVFGFKLQLQARGYPLGPENETENALENVIRPDSIGSVEMNMNLTTSLVEGEQSANDQGVLCSAFKNENIFTIKMSMIGTDWRSWSSQSLARHPPVQHFPTNNSCVDVDVHLKYLVAESALNLQPTVSIVHFQRLDTILKSDDGQTKRSNFSDTHSRNSSWVTVAIGSDIFGHLQVNHLMVSIRFRDLVFKSENDSLKENLICGCLQDASRSSPEDNSVTVIPDAGCKLVWHPEGMTCVCNHQGTFAILNVFRAPQEWLTPGTDLIPDHILFMCCGVGLALTALTSILLMSQFKWKVSVVIMSQIEVSVLMTCFLVTIILAISNLFPQSVMMYLTATLQFFLLASLVCQINLPVFLYFKPMKSLRLNEAIKMLLAMDLILPGMFCGLSVAFIRQVDKLEPFVDAKGWFISAGSFQVICYTLANNIFLAALLIFASGYLITKSCLPLREVLVHHQCLRKNAFFHGLCMTVVIAMMNLSAFLYAKGHQGMVAELLFVLSCPLCGMVVFWFYIINGEKSHLIIPAMEANAYRLNNYTDTSSMLFKECDRTGSKEGSATGGAFSYCSSDEDARRTNWKGFMSLRQCSTSENDDYYINESTTMPLSLSELIRQIDQSECLDNCDRDSALTRSRKSTFGSVSGRATARTVSCSDSIPPEDAYVQMNARRSLSLKDQGNDLVMQPVHEQMCFRSASSSISAHWPPSNWN